MLVFLLEEPSMEALLEGLLPRMLPESVGFKLVPHEGKSDLEKALPRLLRAWQDPHARFVVVRDQDSGDCHEIKRRLVGLCIEGKKPEALVRIACREMEAWFLGDLLAVERALEARGLAKLQQKRKFREPDRLGTPSRELRALVPGYGKVSGARALGPELDLVNVRSASFSAFVSGVRRLASGA